MDSAIRERLQRSHAATKPAWRPFVEDDNAVSGGLQFPSGVAHLTEATIFVASAVASVRGKDRDAVDAFYSSLSPYMVLAVFDAWHHSEWDIYPHLWEPQQVAEAIVRVAPHWSRARGIHFIEPFPRPRYDAGRAASRRVPRPVYLAPVVSYEFSQIAG